MWCGWSNRAFWLVFYYLQYELKTSQSQADTLYGNSPGALNSAFNNHEPSFILGRSLIYLSTLILLLILRHTITLLRSLGLATVLPLDNNIYLHKMVGTLIFIHAWSHTITHLCNFGEFSFPGGWLLGFVETSKQKLCHSKQSGASYLSQDVVMFLHASCEGLPGQ